jgi:enamine deaminase RidA (YjgF/YER057c/UK114 family)
MTDPRPSHQPINPPTLAAPVGFSHAIVSHRGRTLWLAGQNGTGPDGRILAPVDLVAQTDQALANLLTVVDAAGGRPSDVVHLNLYVADVAAYRAARRELGVVWRKHFGRYYPALTLLGVAGFFDPDALIEVDGVAVIRAETDAAPA